MPSAIVFFATPRSGSPGPRSSSSVLKATEPHEEASTAQGAGVFIKPQRVAVSLGLATWSLGVRGRSGICFVQQPLGCVFVALASVLCQRARFAFC